MEAKVRLPASPPPAPQPPSTTKLGAAGERLLTAKEAAQFLRVSLSFLAKARMKGDGPAYVKMKRSVRYRELDLIQWMKGRRRLSTSEQS
jgi:predicted DNA-binding transcriptional regulator AlpA